MANGEGNKMNHHHHHHHQASLSVPYNINKLTNIIPDLQSIIFLRILSNSIFSIVAYFLSQLGLSEAALGPK